MAQAVLDIITSSLGDCLSCFPRGSSTLKINNRSFKILRLLGEGGFSYVYLVADTATGEHLALKKIRCPFGAESVAQALREVEAYRLFGHVPGIIRCLGHALATDGGAPQSAPPDPAAAQTVYVLLPYYRRGNLQDQINANLVNASRFPERRLARLFLGVCRALQAMHHYRPPADADAEADAQPRHEAMSMQQTPAAADGKKPLGPGHGTGADDEYEADQQRPLMADTGGTAAAAAGATSSYAHRDIKPGNIMISDADEAILMDLGSVAAGPTRIATRSQAVAMQDAAAEHSTMPYRAPELFDVKTGAVVDARVDVWSLGCTLFACLVGKSPFEMRSDETGGSLSICVLSGDWRFPDEEPGGRKRRGGKGKGREQRGGGGEEGEEEEEEEGGISEPMRDLVRRCLKVEPSERPDMDELIERVEGVLDRLPEDGAA
ncbi:hypothetical protein P8C59_007388 [Phyllachora maydis]|uniref:non-specific serine/threonine protein kinase n=1 Tax=Phyllachora maydis TaxID=1825666 RepID=A0AAD9MDH7_9PEZI|nr:hypothetical protein P8C59_007388 [Phyllachora maydis]